MINMQHLITRLTLKPYQLWPNDHVTIDNTPCNIFLTSSSVFNVTNDFGSELIAEKEIANFSFFYWDEFTISQKDKQGNYFLVFQRELSLRHPAYLRLARTFPKPKKPFCNILAISAAKLSRVILKRADKILTGATRSLSISYGNSFPDLRYVYDKHALPSILHV